jgi:putative membrane protein
MSPASDRSSRDCRPLNTLPATASGLAVIAAAACTLPAFELGAQSAQMALHIALMNVGAPLLAAALAAKLPILFARPKTLWLAAGSQLLLLWGWHVPVSQQAAVDSHGIHLLMQLTLFAAAFAFWSAIMVLPGAARWQGVAALLATGKLACLLSALMIFSPRALYSFAGQADNALGDQQLAGLLMITACPISYLTAAVVIAADIIGRPAGSPQHGTAPAGG